jgi:hypothetical protein
MRSRILSAGSSSWQPLANQRPDAHSPVCHETAGPISRRPTKMAVGHFLGNVLRPASVRVTGWSLPSQSVSPFLVCFCCSCSTRSTPMLVSSLRRPSIAGRSWSVMPGGLYAALGGSRFTPSSRR